MAPEEMQGSNDPIIRHVGRVTHADILSVNKDKSYQGLILVVIFVSVVAGLLQFETFRQIFFWDKILATLRSFSSFFFG